MRWIKGRGLPRRSKSDDGYSGRASSFNAAGGSLLRSNSNVMRKSRSDSNSLPSSSADSDADSYDYAVVHLHHRLSGVYGDLRRVLRDVEAVRDSPLGVNLRATIGPLLLKNGVDGSSSSAQCDVLLLRGTLPMTHQGVTYNVPIEIYLIPRYPSEPPTVFVRPVPASMMIKDNHRHVGLDGRVYMAYLHDWIGAETEHDLKGLVAEMSILFGGDPPCYARSVDASGTDAEDNNGHCNVHEDKGGGLLTLDDEKDDSVCNTCEESDSVDEALGLSDRTESSAAKTYTTADSSDQETKDGMEGGDATNSCDSGHLNQLKRFNSDAMESISQLEYCESDNALLQIHVTKISLQNRMYRLKQDANAAERNAVEAKRNNMGKLALVHMQEQQTALEELKYCASILANLHACDLRLTMQGMHKSVSGRTEIGGVIGQSEEGKLDPELGIDPDKLNQALELLQLAHKKEEGGAEAKVDETGEDEQPGHILQPDKPTPQEIDILCRSSHISSLLVLPWSDSEAGTYNYSPHRSWKDPDGLLELSEVQKDKFYKWARPSEIMAMRHPEKLRKSSSSNNIVMINSVTPYTIKQHCVSDCSFIAGLCISAAFEQRFDRRLISSLIYPQDRKTGIPIYNPKGVYMVKLWFNGVARRVLVDDLFPVDKDGNLLCSHTMAPPGFKGLELWVSLLEKAYMKLCGGYNFQGSNSGVDLFCLTGWIPESIKFPEDPANVGDFEVQVERVFSANSRGVCLITVSTSKELTEDQAEEVGLYTGHAYAVLRVVQASNGTRLVQLKNPWASKGWKGRFSAQDKDSWADLDFCKEDGYDATLSSHNGDGVFWMSWEDVLLYFRNIHVSWSTDPDFFQYHTAVHGFWDRRIGPSDDSYNVGENPQYTIKMSKKAIQSKATLWLLLSRHVSKQEQEEESGGVRVLSRDVADQEEEGNEVSNFLSMQIHQINKPEERIWYPDCDRAYTNNQHVLVRYDVTGPEDKYLSIVLSQYTKSTDLGYTLSCYCNEQFSLGRPEPRLPICRQLSSSWKLRDSETDNPHCLAIGTAGGSQFSGSFGSNPQWNVDVPTKGAKIQVTCTAPEELKVNVILVQSEQKGRKVTQLYSDPIIDTQAYRHGFAVSEVAFVPGGLYTLVASTHKAEQVGDYNLQVLSSKELQVVEIDSA